MDEYSESEWNAHWIEYMDGDVNQFFYFMVTDPDRYKALRGHLDEVDPELEAGSNGNGK